MFFVLALGTTRDCGGSEGFVIFQSLARLSFFSNICLAVVSVFVSIVGVLFVMVFGFSRFGFCCSGVLFPLLAFGGLSSIAW